MKILLVNKFYYPRGGDCTVLLGTERLLQSMGHEVEVYAMHYASNLGHRMSPLWASEVNFAGGLAAKFKAVQRIMGMGDIARSFETVLEQFGPEVVHLHNIHSYLSPVVARLAHEHGCRVVWTMHDYKLMCPSYLCLADGRPCKDCIAGSKTGVLKHRCMKGSLMASAVAWIEALRWNRKTLERYTDTFICPSQFMAQMMCEAGFDRSRIAVISNFTDMELGEVSLDREDYYCYVGRLSAEKGVDHLLRAASTLPHRLKVAGSGPLEDSLRKQYGNCGNIQFLGRIEPQQVASLLSHARASVMPSQCYDNNPMGVIESLYCGTPVVGARMGGIPELISPESGIVYDKPEQLADSITQVMSRKWNHETIALTARSLYDGSRHQELLMKAYRGEISLKSHR